MTTCASLTKVRLRRLRGRFTFVWLDSHGEGLPVELHRRAWRPFIYRSPRGFA